MDEVKDFKDVALDKVIVDNVDEEVGIVDGHNVAVRGGIGRVSRSPCRTPKRECLLLPYEKGCRIDDRWLADLSSWEYSPRYRNRTICVRVTNIILVYRLIVHTRSKTIENANKDLEELWRGEELDIGLLVYNTSRSSPSHRRVRRIGTIDAWLRVDGPESRLIES